MYLKPVSVHTVIPASGCSTHFSLFGLNLSVPCCCTPMILKGLGGNEQKLVPEDSTPCLKDEVVVGLLCEMGYWCPFVLVVKTPRLGTGRLSCSQTLIKEFPRRWFFYGACEVWKLVVRCYLHGIGGVMHILLWMVLAPLLDIYFIQEDLLINFLHHIWDFLP